MPLGKHLDDAASRLEDARRRIAIARELTPTNENLRVWLMAVTDYVEATHDVQRFSDEALNERVQELAAKLGSQKGARP